MNIDDLKKGDGFLPPPVKRTIKWDGQTGEVWVRHQSFATMALYQTQAPEERINAMVRDCIRLGEGDVQLTMEQAASLKPSLALAMTEAIAEVNKLGKEPDPKKA